MRWRIEIELWTLMPGWERSAQPMAERYGPVSSPLFMGIVASLCNRYILFNTNNLITKLGILTKRIRFDGNHGK